MAKKDCKLIFNQKLVFKWCRLLRIGTDKIMKNKNLQTFGVRNKLEYNNKRGQFAQFLHNFFFTLFQFVITVFPTKCEKIKKIKIKKN